MIHRSIGFWHCTAPLFFLACGPAVQQPEPPPSAASPGSTQANAAAPSTTASGTAETAPPPSNAAPQPEARSPFSVVAVGVSNEIAMHSLNNAVFFGDTNYLVEARGDELVERPDLLGKMNLGSDQYLAQLVGTWPGDTWAVTTIPGGCEPGTGYLSHWTREKWVRSKTTSGAYTGAAPWKNGSVLLLGGYYMEMTLSVAGGRAGVKAPKLPQAQPGDDSSPFIPQSMAALPTGEVFVVGNNSDGQISVARWTPESQTPIMTSLPDCRGDNMSHNVTGIMARSGSEAYLYGNQSGRGYVVTFNGTAYRCEEVPASQEVADLALGSDGSLWGVFEMESGKELWKRPSAGAWQKVPLPTYVSAEGAAPQPFLPTAVHVNGPDDIWLSGYLDPNITAAIAHSRPASKVTQIPPDDEARLKRAEYEPPVPATRSCTTIFAKLYTLSKGAPANFDFPLTRQALKGHTEFSGLEFIEAESLGKRYFGVMARNYDEGVKIVDIIKKGVKGSSPILLCRTPYQINRQIRFDLRSGDMLPDPAATKKP